LSICGGDVRDNKCTVCAELPVLIPVVRKLLVNEYWYAVSCNFCDPHLVLYQEYTRTMRQVIVATGHYSSGAGSRSIGRAGTNSRNLDSYVILCPQAKRCHWHPLSFVSVVHPVLSHWLNPPGCVLISSAAADWLAWTMQHGAGLIPMMTQSSAIILVECIRCIFAQPAARGAFLCVLCRDDSGR
jgi:hypothetical protein